MRFSVAAFFGLMAVVVLGGFFCFSRPAQALDCELGGTDCDAGFYCDTLNQVCEELGTEPAAPASEDDNSSVQSSGPTTADFNDIVGTDPQGAGAVGLIFAGICSTPPPTDGGNDACHCRGTGDCSLDEILQVFVNVTIFILGISGSVILLMFVYGGFLWVTSRGDAKRIEKGKDTITHAVIGFAIILLGYSMINFVIASLAGDAPGETLDETIDNADDKNPDLNTSGQ